MEKGIKHVASLLFAALMLMLVSGILGGIIGYDKGVSHCGKLPMADTVVVHRIDSVFIESVPDTVTMEYTKVVKVPIYVATTDTVVDSVLVRLPFEQHRATLEDVADVWYSGYEARIDSAVVYRHHTTEIIKQPYEVYRMPRLTAELGAGAFYFENVVNPYAIGKIGYNAKHTTFSAFGAINHEGKWAAGGQITYRLNLIK